MTTEFLLAVAGTTTALTIVLGAIYSIYRIAKRIGDALGVDEEGRTIADRLGRVEHQLWENGGSSLADRVNNIELHVVKVSAEVEIIKDITLGLHNHATGVLPVAQQPRKRNTRKAS
jgi:hypothetical protein